MDYCCRSRKYFFEIRKCGRSDCQICGPTVLSTDSFAALQSFPDPVPADGDHYKPFAEVYGTATTQQHCPSVAAASAKATASAGTAGGVSLKKETVRCIVKCVECEKPRCIFSNKKLSAKQQEEPSRLLETYQYVCGSSLIPEGDDVLGGVVAVRPGLVCSTHTLSGFTSLHARSSLFAVSFAAA